MRHNIYLDLIGFTVAAGSLAYHHFFNRAARVKRALGKVPRGRIGSAVEGEVVKVVGRIDYLEEPLTSPLSGRRCAYYELTIEEMRGGGRSSQWVTVVQEASGRDFLLRDGSGTALVRPALAEVAVHKDEHHISGALKDATPELEALLERHGQKSTGTLGFNRKLRYDEGVLEAGEHAAVCGRAMRWRPGAAGGADREVPGGQVIRLLFEQRVETPLYISDDPAAILKTPRRARS
jgi:hypothetical protein